MCPHNTTCVLAGLGHLGLLMSDISIRAARRELETRGWVSAPAPEPAAAGPPRADQQRRVEAASRELTKLLEGEKPHTQQLGERSRTDN